MQEKYTKEKLEKHILEENLSYEAIGRIYNITGAAIKKAALKFNIPLKSRRKINETETFNKKEPTRFCIICNNPLDRQEKFCSRSCHQENLYNEWVERWQKGEETGIKGEHQISNYLKRFIFNKYDSKCCNCNWSEINNYTNTIPLETDHIDGNYQNNEESNLRLLCPNCHSLTPTYKGANRGNGRESRRK